MVLCVLVDFSNHEKILVSGQTELAKAKPKERGKHVLNYVF